MTIPNQAPKILRMGGITTLAEAERIAIELRKAYSRVGVAAESDPATLQHLGTYCVTAKGRKG